MTEVYLLPKKTVIRDKGDGAALDLGKLQGRIFLLTLEITDIIEQQALDVSVCGSADGSAWDAKPIVAFPQKFYRGETHLLLDLTARPEVKFIRAHWEANRWGRGTETPMFEFHVAVREVPDEILAEAAGRVRAG